MKKLFILLAAAACMLTACKNETQSQGVNFIFETDLGNDVDDILALDMIYKYQDMGDINLMGVCLNKEGVNPIGCLDILNTFYGYPDIPVGTVRNGADCANDAVNYTKIVCDMTDSLGNPVFARSKDNYENCPDAHILYRKLLAGAKDHSVSIASVGFSTNLARLLDTPADEYSKLTGKELVAKKVKVLAVMAGAVQNPMPEYNVIKDIPAAQKVFAEWPTEIIMSPFELGIQTLYPAEAIESNFGWIKHPVAEAYKAYREMPYSNPLWDLTAVLYAVEGDKWFNVSEPGNVVVTDESHTIFTADPNGKVKVLSVTPEQAQAIVGRIVELNGMKPLCK